MTTGEQCEPLPWDSDFFGLPIARLRETRLTRELWQGAEAWCRGRGVRCLYCFLDPDFQSTGIVEAGGGHLVDTRITFEWRGAEAPPVPTSPGRDASNRIRAAGAADMPSIESIAARSHRGRFHVDRHFDPAKADEMYRVWIRKGRDEKKHDVLVAIDNATDEIRGYCACARKVLPSRQTVGVIDLIAVDEASRAGGIGRDLITAALSYFVARGMTTIHLVTQAQNIAAQRLYQRCGFLSTGCQLIYHKWFD